MIKNLADALREVSILGQSNAIVFDFLRSQGYTGSINEMMYEWLGDNGYTGQLNERMYKHAQDGSPISFVPQIPQVLSAPVVVGIGVLGALLEATPASFSGSPTSVVGQWFANGVAIPGETGLTYIVHEDEYPADFTYRSTASNSEGTADSLSNVIESIEIPVSLTAPVAAGTVGLGNTLTVTPGTYSNEPDVVTGEWYDEVGATGETGLSLTVSDEEMDYYYVEMATNLAGSVAVFSNTLAGVSGIETIAYAQAGFSPQVVADFSNNFYAADQTIISGRTLVPTVGTGLATMVDSDGVTKWVPHNLLRYSDQFENSTWLKQGSGTGVPPVVTANNAVAPDGTMTADTIVFNKGAGTTVADQSVITQTVSGVELRTHSVWLRADTPVTLVSRSPQNNGTYEGIDVTTTWTLFEVSDPDLTVSSTTHQFGLRAGTGTTLPDTATVEVWGAHMYRSDLGGMADNPDTGDSYVPTGANPVYLMREQDHAYDPVSDTWVNKGLLFEPAATQLNLFSDTLDPAGGKNVSINGNVITADASNGQHRYGYSFTPAGGAVTTVVEVERINDRFFQCYDFTGAGIYVNYLNFDAVLGVVTDKGSNTTGYAEPVGPNKWRLVVTFGAAVPASGNIRYGFLATGTDPHGATVNTIGVEQWGISKMNAFNGTRAYSYFPTNGAVGVRAADPAGVTIPAALMPVTGQNETTGTELVTEPNLLTANGVTSRVYRVDGEPIESIPVCPVEAGKYYKVESLIAAKTGAVSYRVALSSGNLTGELAPTVGSQSFVFYANTSGGLTLNGDANGALLEVDYLSVKEVDPPAFTIQIEGDVTYEDNNTPSEVSFFVWPDGNTGSIDARLRTNVGSGQFQVRSLGLGTDALEQGGADDLSPSVALPFNACSTFKDGFIGYSLNGAADDGRTGTNNYANFTPSNFLIAPNFHGHIKQVVVWNEDITQAGREAASFLDVPAAPIAPEQITDLVVTSSADGTSAILNWTAPNLNGETGQFYTARLTEGGDETVLLDEISPAVTTYQFDGFSPGAIQQWTLTTTSTGGTSIPSNSASVTLADVPDTPTVALVSEGDGQYVYSFTTPIDGGSALLDVEEEKTVVS